MAKSNQVVVENNDIPMETNPDIISPTKMTNSTTKVESSLNEHTDNTNIDTIIDLDSQQQQQKETMTTSSASVLNLEIMDTGEDPSYIHNYFTLRSRHNSNSTMSTFARPKPQRGVFAKLFTIFINWIHSEGRGHLLAFLFTAAQIVFFAYSYLGLLKAAELSMVRGILGHGLIVARSAANIINLTASLLLFTVSRNTITFLRNTHLSRIVPLDDFIGMHKYIAWSLIVWSSVHTFAHYVNYRNISLNTLSSINPMNLAFLSGPGLTGQVLCATLVIIFTCALAKVRKAYFEIFWYFHHLFILFYAALILHGAFCFIKANPGSTSDECRGGPSSWKWCLLSFGWYALDRLYGVLKCRKYRTIQKIVQHPSNTLELQMEKAFSKYRPGQYIFLCCPEISPFQWHPFTITSSPDDDYISVHMRLCGDWTKQLRHYLVPKKPKNDTSLEDTPVTIPMMKIAGPYGAPAEDVFQYRVSVMIGAGIGVTPFASILKDIWFKSQGISNTSSNGKQIKRFSRHKFYFIWICRDQTSFEWLQELLARLEEDCYPGQLVTLLYFTGTKRLNNRERSSIIFQADEMYDPLTGLQSKTHYGRPNFNKLFGYISEDHPNSDVGVFFCGPDPMAQSIRKSCDKATYDMTNNTMFYFQKEHF